jgi:5-methylthioribose kinase
MNYYTLDENTIIEYVRNTKGLSGFFAGQEISAKEIGDGNLNLVFIVKSSKNSIIIKQAIPYLRCVGESYPLAKERMLYEIRSMLEYERLSPTSVPKIYHTDEEMCLIAMQNLSSHIIMRKGILEGIKYEKFADHISSHMVNTLFGTSSFGLSSADKRALMDRFTMNTELCKLSEDFVFSSPYMTDATNRHNPEIDEDVKKIRHDEAFKIKASELKYIFMNKTEALIHGDLHTGSVMLNIDETFVIDSEFAFFGPIGFDVGAVFGNLLMAYISYSARDNKDYQEWLLKCAMTVLRLFEEKFLLKLNSTTQNALTPAQYFDGMEGARENLHEIMMKKIMSETIGFAGCKMMRRQMGVAHILEIESIEDPKTRAEVEKAVIKLAREFVLNYEKLDNINDIFDTVKRILK